MNEGKELEIRGLRKCELNNIFLGRQLKSMNMSKALCKKCEGEIAAPQEQADKIANNENNSRKRARFDV